MPHGACPTCKRKLDAAEAPTKYGGWKVRPRPGDLSVCLGCGEILEFKEDMQLAAISLNHMLELPPETSADLIRVQRRIRSMRPLDE